MTAHATVVTNAGTTLSISASLPATYDAAGYAATTITYTAVGQVEDHGAHGVSANVTKFTPVDTNVVSKSKGAKDYGVKTVRIGNIASDAGQVIVKAASESNSRYSVKIAYADGEIHYLDVLVTKYEYNDGSSDNNRTINCTLEICRAPVIVAAS
ncbi:MAG: hypothetical protein WC100_00915 [Sterolibacterium sp.]